MKGKFVFTGAPGVGKTTLIDYLSSSGYAVVTETARDVIEQQQKTNGTILPWINQMAFQKRVLSMQLARENDISSNLVFIDRGILDGIAYLRVAGLEVPNIFLNNAYNRYDCVFLIEPLSTYVRDHQRREKHKISKKLHQILKETYQEFGYKIITVSANSIEKRVDFIISSILMI
jgi:predicted ATPase